MKHRRLNRFRGWLIVKLAGKTAIAKDLVIDGTVVHRGGNLMVLGTLTCTGLEVEGREGGTLAIWGKMTAGIRQ